MTIRLATEADAGAIAAIYAPACESSAISFESSAPAPAEMAQRIGTITRQFPWLVLDDAENVAGYAYSSAHRERAAYGWSTDVSVYVSPAYFRRGVGRALYTALLPILGLQGYHNVYAGITLPNPASVGLHEAVGFRPLVVYRRVGFKLGAWHDVAWYELDLQPRRSAPPPPRPVTALMDSPEWADALQAGLKRYRR